MSYSSEAIALQTTLETGVAPQNSTEIQLTKIWEQLLEIEPISVKDNFFDLGGDSLLALRLFTQIEQTFGKNLSLSTLLEAPTVEQLASVLGRETESASWSTLVPIQSSGSKPPFFCVHGNGANVLIFKDLAHLLGSEQPFYGLQARGVDGKQEPLSRIEDMAAFYIQEIRTLQPEGPYFLGGYSSGGLVAFEMARQLQQQGEKVAFLGLIDSFVPSAFQPVSFRERLARHWRNLFRFGPKHPLKMIKHSYKRGYFRTASRMYQSLGQSWFDWHPKIKRKYVTICIRRAVKEFVPQVYPGQVTLFRACEPPMGWYYYGKDFPTPDDWYDRDPQHGWGTVAGGGVEVYDVPGDHGSIVRDPERVKVLAAQLQTCLDKGQQLTEQVTLEEE